MRKQYRSIDEIIADLRQAADSGDIRSAQWLSWIFYSEGWNRQDDELALRYSLIAANAGNSTAMCRTAVLYSEGYATEKERLKDVVNSNDPFVAYAKGLAADLNKAEQWIHLAAQDPKCEFAHHVLSACVKGECLLNAISTRVGMLDRGI